MRLCVFAGVCSICVWIFFFQTLTGEGQDGVDKNKTVFSNFPSVQCEWQYTTHTLAHTTRFTIVKT